MTFAVLDTVKRLSNIFSPDGICKEIAVVEEALSELPAIIHQTGDVLHILDQLDGESRWDKFTERFTCESVKLYIVIFYEVIYSYILSYSIPMYFRALDTLRKQSNIHTCVISLTRQRILYVEATLYTFIFGICLSTARKVIANHRSSCVNKGGNCGCFEGVHAHEQWLIRLVLKIDNLLLITPNKFTLYPSDFLPKLQDATPYLHEVPSSRNRYQINVVPEQLVLNALRNVLYQWLHIPADKNAEYRSVIVENLHQVLGAGALLLPSVWQLCSTTPEWIYTNTHEYRHRQRATNAIPLSVFVQSIKAIPNPVREQLDLLWTRYKSLGTGLRSNGRIVPTKTIPSNDSSSFESVASASESLKAFKAFLLDCWKVVEGLTPTNSSFREKLRAQPDFYHPLREHAPSRLNFIRKVQPATLKTPLGFFNLILFRILMFNSDAGRETDYNFDLDSLEQFRLANDIAYYYNPTAYGSTNDGRRDPDLYRLYWILSEALWPNLLSRNEGIQSALRVYLLC